MVNGSRKIHPSLKGMATQFHAAITISIIICMAAAVGAWFWEGPNFGIGLSVLTVLLIVGAVYMRAGLTENIRRASGLLDSQEPVPMTMHRIGVSDLSGTYAALNFQEPSRGYGTLIVSLKEGRLNPIPKEIKSVQVYFDPGSLDRFLTIWDGSRAFWGHLTTPEIREANQRRFRNVYWVISLLFLLALGLLAREQFLNIEDKEERLQLARASLTWPVASGTILTSEIHLKRIRKGRITVRGYEPVIQYRFAVGQKEYRGGVIHFAMEPMRDRGNAEMVLAKYPPGQQVGIAYDPKNPEYSVLEPGHVAECENAFRNAKPGLIIAAVAGGVCLIAVFMVWWWLGNLRQRLMAGVLEAVGIDEVLY